MELLDDPWPQDLFGEKPLIRGMGICPVRAGEAQSHQARSASLMLFPYRSRLIVNGMPLAIEAGMLALAPPDSCKRHEPEEDSSHIWLDFDLPGGCPGAGPVRFLLGREYAAADAALRDVLAARPIDPLRAEVRLWEFLLRLRSVSRRGAEGRHRAVEETVARIETGLHGHLDVDELAAAAGISRSYLTRLFRRSFGSSCASYIIARRMERARWLLAATDRSIKSVAAEVGMADLQAFNKAVRRAFGRSPRALREGGGDHAQGSERSTIVRPARGGGPPPGAGPVPPVPTGGTTAPR